MVDVAPLSQMDPRWKSNLLGFDSSSTIGSYGCLLTSMTMVANAYGFSETPDTLNNKMKAVGGFQGSMIMPALLPKALPGLVYQNFLQCPNQPAPLAEIDASLAAGKLVIIEVDYSPSPGLQNHWIVLYAKSGSDYLLRDPYPYPVVTSPTTLLASRYKFAGDPAKIIQAVVFLSGTGASQPVAQPPANLDKGVRASFPVYATADGLALRSDTIVADNTLIKRVALGAKLAVLEGDQAANAKIGVLNQWLAVLDPADNTQGYAAAWYLSTSPQPAPPAVPAQPPAPAPQSKPANLVVKTVSEGVALRSQPQISDATLAKRVPVNTELLCGEPYDQALAKVGVVYQWLQVQDVEKKPYYVAAWYVTAVNALATLGVKQQGSGVSFDLDVGEPRPLILRAAAEGLALRTLPLITADTLIKRLPINGELIALEPPENGRLKVGRMGEWLHVRDVEGTEGYVAAWYTIQRPELLIDPALPELG